MRYRGLGRTGLEVSEISLGSWLTFGGSLDERMSVDLIHRAFDLGVNFFDTANVYSGGRAEEIVGRALATLPREEVLVGTKLFFPVGPDPEDQGLSRAAIARQSEASLRRLGLDVIDLYQCHRFDEATPLEETCEAMDDLARAGKIRHWGVSEWTAEQIASAVDLCEREGLAPPATDQPRYSMLERGIEDDGVLHACARVGLGVVVFSPLAQGVLSGKYSSPEAVPAGSRAADPNGRMFIERFLAHDLLARVDRLRPIAAELGVTLAQLALAWILRHRYVTSAIVGATRLEQLEENVGASGMDLDLEAVRRIDAVVS
jgi:aryl-alcohol dehydrogenase-like predicted oxidoreductase